MTSREIGVTTCIITKALALADKRVMNTFEIEKSLLERMGIDALGDMLNNMGIWGMETLVSLFDGMRYRKTGFEGK